MVAARRRQTRRGQVIAIGLVVVVIAGIALFTSGGKKSKKVASTGTTTVTPTTASQAPPTVASATITGDTPCPQANGSSARTVKFAKPPPMCVDPSKTYTATMETDAGTITIVLDPKKAPKTANNFVVLARYHYFDGIVFHRVIPGFVVQGGDPAGTGSGGPGYMFADELPKAGDYKVGSLAMANSGANTNGSQFFIITGDQGVALPPSYSLFGQVTAGMDVVKKIEADGDTSGTPKTLHHMVKVTIAES
ncbi:MAG: peptidylprolyl isomerase [Acidimicrobiales bacterium]|nr:peptidylprolyl isomerase [Acidimicrobiales bacterium]